MALMNNEMTELLKAMDPHVKELIAYHREKSVRWMPHEVVPWGRGESFEERPWAEGQCPLTPEIVTALETNLLTEDNLPYYHSTIAAQVDEESAFGEWNRIWTSEEALHSAVIRDYIYLMRAMDPALMESNRLTVMQTGYSKKFANPVEIFVYTSAQELATRISHMAVGQQAGEPILQKLLALVARDENFHHLFYRSIVKEMLRLAPDVVLQALVNQLYGFDMPGAMMPNFDERSKVFAGERIFGALEFRDNVVKPLLNYWGIEGLTGLKPESQKLQERILKLERVLDRVVLREARELRPGAAVSAQELSL